MSATTARQRLLAWEEAGLIHNWTRQGQMTVLALGPLPDLVAKKDGGQIIKGPGRSVPREAYSFDFEEKSEACIIRVCPMSGDWWSVDPLGREEPVNGVGRVLDLDKEVRHG